MGWEWLVLVAVVAVVFALGSVFREVWAHYRAGRRSLATVLAITCIVAGMPVVFVATALEQSGPAELRGAVEAVGMVLVIGGGVFGAVGLVLDRRLRKTGGTQPTDPDTG